VIDVAARRLTGTLRLPDHAKASSLLLSGDRALLVVPDVPGAVPQATATARPGADSGPVPTWAPGARLVLVGLAGTPTILGTLDVQGSYVDARQVGSTVRVVVRSAPRLDFRPPRGQGSAELSAATRANRAVLARSTMRDWLPGYALTKGGHTRSGTLVDCTRVQHPQRYSGRSMLTVLTFGLGGALGTGDPMAIAADGDTVYATTTSLYVAGSRPAEQPGQPWSGRESTEIHEFALPATGPPRYLASGQVEGHLLNQYALSEYQGTLRVATTRDVPASSAPTPPKTPSPTSIELRTLGSVTMLGRHGDRLEPLGRVDGLGAGERITAVRFAGPVGYVVTFRQTDPLFTLDLADPAHPRAVGELKLTGSSAYLHPVDAGRLIGVGTDATADGLRIGSQVSLFDVTDPGRPRRLAETRLPFGNSEVETDPHAFLYWPASGLVVVPMSQPGWIGLPRGPEWPGVPPGFDSPGPILGGGTGAVRVPPWPQPSSQPWRQPFEGALVLRVEGHHLTRVGLLQQPRSEDRRALPWFTGGDTRLRRALVVGDTLWTVSAAGVMASGARTLARRAWLPFP
jgi:hypothetical protein